MLHKVIVAGIAIDPESNTPVIILEAVESKKIIPVLIGVMEAISIVSSINKFNFDKPMIHDLFKNFSKEMEAYVTRVDLCNLDVETFYAIIHFLSKEREFCLEANPSDAIAVAMRFDAPIFVDESIIAGAGPKNDEVEIIDNSDEGIKLATYLQNLSMEDFGEYKN